MTEQNRQTPIGNHRLFLDRYAQKDESGEIRKGDTVVFSTGNPRRDYGTVVSAGNNITVRTEDRTVTVPKELVEKPVETSIPEMMQRVAESASIQEKTKDREIWARRFRWLLGNFRFIPSGRILAGAGTSSPITYFNGHILPSPGDSRISIVQRLEDIAEIMSRDGEAGMNISSIRPKSASVRKIKGSSSGSVSWSGLYSFAVGLIGQGRQGRGTLKLTLDDWHPDIMEFIEAKRDPSRLPNIRLAVNISDRFMEALSKNGSWTTVFPDTTDPAYDSEWNGDIEKWRKKHKVNTYRTYKAWEIWNALVHTVLDCGEPDILFGGTCNRMSNTSYCNTVRCTNPFGELSFPDWSTCCLGTINIPAFLNEEGKIDRKMLSKAVHYAVRFLDDMIDETPYFLENNRYHQHSERRIGIGVTGLAELFLKRNIRYGSKESLTISEKIFKLVATEAYLASSELAKEKGSFPLFAAKGFLSGGFVKNLPEKVRTAIASNGIRNASLLSQAPTGLTSQLACTSQGIEPYSCFETKGKQGIEAVPEYERWRSENHGEKMPEWFVTSRDIPLQEQASVVALIQKWTDASVAKTFQIEGSEPEKLALFIIEMYRQGLKSLSFAASPQTRQKAEAKEPEADNPAKARIAELEGMNQELSRQIETYKDTNLKLAKIINSNISKSAGENPIKARTRSDVMHGITIRKETPAGVAYITLNEDEYNEVFEVFATMGKASGDVISDAQGLCRLVSLILRMPSPYTPDERARAVIEQLKGIGPTSVSGNGMASSLPDGIAYALESFLAGKDARAGKREDEGV